MAHSPWGKIQHSEKVCKGVRWVSTAGHGGLMVTREWALAHLSEAARSRGIAYGSRRVVKTKRDDEGGLLGGTYEVVTPAYFCFEEDCDWAIPLWEMAALWPQAFAHRAKFSIAGIRQELRESLSRWNADYLIERNEAPEPNAFAEWQARHEAERRRAERDPNLIVSAINADNGAVAVTTADGIEHFVTQESYRLAHEEGRTDLDRCVPINMTSEAPQPRS